MHKKRRVRCQEGHRNTIKIRLKHYKAHGVVVSFLYALRKLIIDWTQEIQQYVTLCTWLELQCYISRQQFQLFSSNIRSTLSKNLTKPLTNNWLLLNLIILMSVFSIQGFVNVVHLFYKINSKNSKNNKLYLIILQM